MYMHYEYFWGPMRTKNCALHYISRNSMWKKFQKYCISEFLEGLLIATVKNVIRYLTYVFSTFRRIVDKSFWKRCLTR